MFAALALAALVLAAPSAWGADPTTRTKNRAGADFLGFPPEKRFFAEKVTIFCLFVYCAFGREHGRISRVKANKINPEVRKALEMVKASGLFVGEIEVL